MRKTHTHLHTLTYKQIHTPAPAYRGRRPTTRHPHRNILQQHTATHCNNILQHIATTYCNTLPHTTYHGRRTTTRHPHHNILQHIATTYCNNILQHIATHCIARQATVPECGNSQSARISARILPLKKEPYVHSKEPY